MLPLKLIKKIVKKRRLECGLKLGTWEGIYKKKSLFSSPAMITFERFKYNENYKPHNAGVL